MIVNYEYGFKYKGVLYGWKDKKLYKLPQTIGVRSYALSECKLIKVGNSKGYNVGRDKKSLNQLKSMTIFINHKIEEIKSKDLPF